MDALIEKVIVLSVSAFNVLMDCCFFCLTYQAKDMVGLVNKFAAKLEEKKGALSEDEVIKVTG